MIRSLTRLSFAHKGKVNLRSEFGDWEGIVLLSYHLRVLTVTIPSSQLWAIGGSNIKPSDYLVILLQVLKGCTPTLQPPLIRRFVPQSMVSQGS